MMNTNNFSLVHTVEKDLPDTLQTIMQELLKDGYCVAVEVVENEVAIYVLQHQVQGATKLIEKLNP